MRVIEFQPDNSSLPVDSSPQAPSGAAMLTIGTYREVLPKVRKYLNLWKDEAEKISNPELRKQALLSIETKAFHCAGGSLYGLLAGDRIDLTIRFIVAYQTICDYLDNLCDRSTSLDPEDFRNLHQACVHALTPTATCINYYQFRTEQDDNGYLVKLVRECQDILKQLPAYLVIAPHLAELVSYYCDLQVHKHVAVAERVPRLKAWFAKHRDRLPDMQWYEFSACTGSTLGIFCLVAYAADRNCSQSLAIEVKNGYFPWVQGLHILLDYLIDREEDLQGGDLNFCNYYDSEGEIGERLVYFFQAADRAIDRLPDRDFHRLINRALLGVYLSDRKVTAQTNVKIVAKKLLQYGGGAAFFFLGNRLMMEWIRQQYKLGRSLVNNISIEQFAIGKIKSLHNQPQI